MQILVFLTLLALACLLLAERAGYRPGVWIAKPAASSGFVAVGLASGAPLKIADGDLYAAGLMAGLVLSWLGDVFLIPRARPAAFRLGLFAFLLGHVAYVLAFASRGLDPVAAGAGAVVLAIPAAWVLRWLGPRLPAGMLAPVRAYVAVISVMLLFAVATTFHQPSTLILTGAAMFYLSDLAVARDRFIAPGFENAAWGLPLYYGGQLALALSLA